jgi:hypothetical protein
MERLSIIISILLRDDGFMYIFWAVLCGFNLFWDSYCFRSKHLTENELVAISPNFKGINSAYLLFALLGFLLFCVPYFALSPRLDQWALMNYGRRFSPSITFIFAGLGIYQGAFAMVKGVYPQIKYFGYIYTDVNRIRRVAMYQIVTSIILVVLSVLVFFVTV